MHMLGGHVITLRDKAPGDLPAGSRRASILLSSGCHIAPLRLKREAEFVGTHTVTIAA